MQYSPKLCGPVHQMQTGHARTECTLERSFWVISCLLWDCNGSVYFPTYTGAETARSSCSRLKSCIDPSSRKLLSPYESADWDPEGRFFPISLNPPFAVKIEGRYYSVYPLVFPACLALLRFLLGGGGEGVLVAGASTILLGLTYRIGNQTAGAPWGFRAILILGFASPIWIYSVLNWGHTCAAALCAFGVLQALKGRVRQAGSHWFLAGVVLGAATWFRTECVALFLSICTAACLWSPHGWKVGLRSAAFLVTGFVAAMVPLGILQWVLYGQPLGLHAGGILAKWATVAQQGGPAYFSHSSNKWLRLSVLDWFFFRSTDYPTFSIKTAVPFILFLITCLVAKWRRNRIWVLLNLSAILLVLLRVLGEVVAGQSRYVTGLFMVMPYCILAFWQFPLLSPKSKQTESPVLFLLGTVVGFLLVCTVINLGNLGGLQWGPRYLMPVFSIFAVLTASTIKETPLLRKGIGLWLVSALVVLGVLFEIIGLTFIRRDESSYQQVVDYVRKHPATAIVGYEKRWLPQMCASLYFEKNLFLANSPNRIRDFLEAEKPFPNDSVLILTHGTPFLEGVSPGGGKSERIADRFWGYTPGA